MSATELYTSNATTFVTGYHQKHQIMKSFVLTFHVFYMLSHILQREATKNDGAAMSDEANEDRGKDNKTTAASEEVKVTNKAAANSNKAECKAKAKPQAKPKSKLTQRAAVQQGS
jgi:hypothetical protein